MGGQTDGRNYYSLYSVLHSNCYADGAVKSKWDDDFHSECKPAKGDSIEHIGLIMQIFFLTFKDILELKKYSLICMLCTVFIEL